MIIDFLETFNNFNLKSQKSWNKMKSLKLLREHFFVCHIFSNDQKFTRTFCCCCRFRYMYPSMRVWVNFTMKNFSLCTFLPCFNSNYCFIQLFTSISLNLAQTHTRTTHTHTHWSRHAFHTNSYLFTSLVIKFLWSLNHYQQNCV